MRLQPHDAQPARLTRPTMRPACRAILALFIAVPAAQASINWDGGAETPWWFDPVNWNTDTNPDTVLPPNDGAASATITIIGNDTHTAPEGDGVVYDPSSADPNFPPPETITFPANFGPQIISDLIISRNAPQDNKLTIRGDLETGLLQVGKSSGTGGVATNGHIVQTAGAVKVLNSQLEIGQSDTENPGFGNGTYDYRGGTLEVLGGAGLRLSHGSITSVGPGGPPAGAGGHGRFIMHNPATEGYVRALDFTFNSYAGTPGGITDIGDPNGDTRGVAIAEFHFENGGVRPIQVDRNLVLNNGFQVTTGGTRSARLDLQLDAPVTLQPDGLTPINLGLFDVDSDGNGSGTVQGTGSLAGILSSADGSDDYEEGGMVSAMFGSTKYNWTISYTGTIAWNGSRDTGLVDSVTPSTTGKDVILVGHSMLNLGLPGDYNNNQIVDAADYVLWRKGGPLANEGVEPDEVNEEDYTFWRSQFGNTLGEPAVGSLANAIPVPEPTSILLTLTAALTIWLPRRSQFSLSLWERVG